MPLPLFLHQLIRPAATTAELVRARKEAVEREFTQAQQRAHEVFKTGRAEVENLAKSEYEAVVATVRNAQERLKAIIDTDALPTEVKPLAEDVHGRLTTSEDRDT